MGQRLFGLDQVDSHTLANASVMALPKGVFFVRPDHFDVDHAINPHMLDENGKPNRIDKGLAVDQWQTLVKVYEGLGLETMVLEPKEDCPDMVFCANQTLPYLDKDGKPTVLLSNMENDNRQKEVESIGASLKKAGFALKPLADRSEDTLFEGMGDALWVPGRKFICGGYGFRTHEDIYQKVHDVLDVPIVTFQLKNPKFYHLDTCLSILDERTVLACKDAFQDEDWQVLHKLFPKVIEVSAKEADSPGFACNAHCPDTKHVILQSGNEETEKNLSDAGFVPIPVETSEFVKSGGSVFCMKQVFFR